MLIHLLNACQPLARRGTNLDWLQPKLPYNTACHRLRVLTMTNDEQEAQAEVGSHPDRGTLPQEALLELNGDGACKFLQGQSTANFEGRSALEVVPGAFCNVKGRIIVDFLALVVSEEKIIFRVSADLAEPIAAHLAKYLMFSKAELRLMPQQPLGLMGSDAHEAFNLSAAPAPGRAQEVPVGWAIGLDTDVSLVIPDGDAEQQGEDALNRNEQFLGAWHSAACQRGEARIRQTTTEKYLPQDVNYDLAGWVSFDKGCYTGQEIIARLHWRGKPKRRLYAATTKGAQPPEGTTLCEQHSGRVMGSVVNSAPGVQDTPLLVETTNDAAGGTLVLEHSDQSVHVSASPTQYQDSAPDG